MSIVSLELEHAAVSLKRLCEKFKVHFYNIYIYMYIYMHGNESRKLTFVLNATFFTEFKVHIVAIVNHWI